MTVARPNTPDPKVFAESVRVLLDGNALRYRAFGEYWFLIKALLKRYYDKHNLAFLAGNYVDPSVNDRIPARDSLTEALQAAAETYAQNAAYNVGRNWCEDDEGERFYLFDPDVEG